MENRFWKALEISGCIKDYQFNHFWRCVGHGVTLAISRREFYFVLKINAEMIDTARQAVRQDAVVRSII